MSTDATPMFSPETRVIIQWHEPDNAYAAVFLRDGKPWFLSGALVGMGSAQGDAVNELAGIARHLVIEGTNFLLNGTLPVADRLWLAQVIGPGDLDLRHAVAEMKG